MDDVLDDYVLTGNINDLDELYLDSKGIQDLTGIENFTGLIYLNCTDNQLTSLDVSNNTALHELWCGMNQITSLDVSNNTALTVLSCWNNQLTSLDVSNNTALTYLSCNDNPNLTCIKVDDATWSTSNWTNIDPQHYFSEACP